MNRAEGYSSLKKAFLAGKRSTSPPWSTGALRGQRVAEGSLRNDISSMDHCSLACGNSRPG
jgi:hypothetical protein